jgi:hypothetical protein
MIFEGSALYVAVKHFPKRRKGVSMLQAIRHSKDPTTFAVILEDSAALVGLGMLAWSSKSVKNIPTSCAFT